MKEFVHVSDWKDFTVSLIQLKAYIYIYRATLRTTDQAVEWHIEHWHIKHWTLWHAKDPSLFYGHECREQVNICSTSTVELISPNECKVLEWDKKPQSNKQTQIIKEMHTDSRFSICF